MWISNLPSALLGLDQLVVMFMVSQAHVVNKEVGECNKLCNMNSNYINDSLNFLLLLFFNLSSTLNANIYQQIENIDLYLEISL